MKIVAPPSPVTSAPPWQRRVAEDPEGHTETFADLLAALLSPRADFEQDRAADLAPRIGSGGRAFEDAQLIVETALAFRPNALGLTGFRARDVLHAELQTRAVNARAYRPAQPPQTLSALLEHWLVRLAPEPAGGAPVASLAVPSAVIKPLVESGDTRIARSVPFFTAASTIRDASQGRASRTDPPETEPSRRTAPPVSPFGAHLLAFEGGLRLLLRLPRLADGERAELEARVARLFETFGHRKHDIVIQEIAKGEG